MTDRRYIEIPGDASHELPPLLIHGVPDEPGRDEVVDRAAALVEAEDLIAADAGAADFEQRKFDLALHLAGLYRSLVDHWAWGDSVVEWIRQCEITFQANAALRPLLHPDVWPHAGRSSFVELLADKAVSTPGIGVEQAVGLRLTFRQPPPIDSLSDQFLFFLRASVADSAYRAWAHLAQDTPSLLPPDRFFFQVHRITREETN